MILQMKSLEIDNFMYHFSRIRIIFTHMKKIATLLGFAFTFFSAYSQETEAYGPFININVYAYKSNLFNSDDLRADSFQKYSITPGFAGSIERGYLYDNGFSYSLGLQFGTNNQKYTGADPNYAYKLTATTKTSFIKVPLTLAHQTRNDKKLKFLYSLGFFYSLNTSYSDQIELDYTNSLLADYTTNITKKEITTKNSLDTAKSSYSFEHKPVNTHGFGALAGAGLSYRLKSRTELMVNLKGEFQFTNLENTDENLWTPTGNTPGTANYKPLYGNYAKYMTGAGAARRAGTRPFNLGLNIGLRFYLFSFQ